MKLHRSLKDLQYQTYTPVRWLTYQSTGSSFLGPVIFSLGIHGQRHDTLFTPCTSG